ncbi:MAG: EamA family transporter, partial [Gammaproteobacteria bacterium]|nr:EamA family transporter [Gammaproteobacteria bacterium]
MMIADIAAFGAAFAWAVGSLISIGPARQLGAVSFNRIRIVVVFVILTAIAASYGGWQTIRMDDLSMLALSGFIGIFIGD